MTSHTIPQQRLQSSTGIVLLGCVVASACTPTDFTKLPGRGLQEQRLGTHMAFGHAVLAVEPLIDGTSPLRSRLRYVGSHGKVPVRLNNVLIPVPLILPASEATTTSEVLLP